MRYYTNPTLYILSLIFLLSSCEKQEFVGDPGTPVFMAEVPFVNGESFEVVAGDELYYMFASHQDTESAVIHSGLFGKEDTCEESCAENFAIRIVQKNSVQDPISKGKYDYYSIPKDGFKHNFSVISSEENFINEATWRLRNENHPGPTLNFNSDNDSAPEEGIQLIYDIPGQLVVQFERPVLPKAVNCNLELKVNRVVNEGIFLEIETGSPYTFVNWSTGVSGNKTKIDFNTSSYSANIFDASGCQTKVVVFFKTHNITKDYSIGLNQESYMFSSPDNADQSVIIEYTNKEGEFFTSSIIGQILPFEFNIEKVEKYENNELEQPTWKIDANFDCILFNEIGVSKRIKNGKAVFAVGY